MNNQEIYCTNCGKKSNLSSKFCASCGTKHGKNYPQELSGVDKENTNKKDVVSNSLTQQEVPDINAGSNVPKEAVLIKCGNCEYNGQGQSNRSTWAQVIAWIFVIISWPITVAYFLLQPKYRCPQCKSKKIAIRYAGDVYVAQRSPSIIPIIIIIIVSIAVIGILSSVVLASLSTARAKSRDARRISDVGQLQLAAELYFDENSAYPSDLQLLSPKFIPKIPTDPTSSLNYTYFMSVDPAVYIIGANLERSDNGALNTDLDYTIKGYYYGSDENDCSGGNNGHCYDISNVTE